MDNRYFTKEPYSLEQMKEEELRTSFQRAYSSSESHRSTFASSSKFTFKTGPSPLEDRLFELNTRTLSIVIKKIVKFEGEIWKKLENDCTKYGIALENLKSEYKEDLEKADALGVEVITLQNNNKKLQERAEELQSKYENQKTKYEIQQTAYDELELKLRKSNLSLEMKIQELHENDKIRKTLSEENLAKDITIQELKKSSQNYQRKLKHFENVRTQPESAKDFIEESLYEIPKCFSKMQSSFWSYIGSYFDKLDNKFKSEIETTRRTELEKFTKHITKQKKESFKKITHLQSERKDEAKLIAKLEEENIRLQNQLASVEINKEASETTSQFSSSFTSSVDINLTFGNADDKGLHDQADFYEALIKLAEEDENETTPEDMKIKWEELRKCHFADPPEHIRKRLETTRQLLDHPSDTSVANGTSLTIRHQDNKESSQDRIDPLAEPSEDEID